MPWIVCYFHILIGIYIGFVLWPFFFLSIHRLVEFMQSSREFYCKHECDVHKLFNKVYKKNNGQLKCKQCENIICCHVGGPTILRPESHLPSYLPNYTAQNCSSDYLTYKIFWGFQVAGISLQHLWAESAAILN